MTLVTLIILMNLVLPALPQNLNDAKRCEELAAMNSMTDPGPGSKAPGARWRQMVPDPKWDAKACSIGQIQIDSDRLIRYKYIHK